MGQINSPQDNSFVVYVLGVVFDTKTRKILIGKCAENPHFSELTWGFPGGKPEKEEEFEECLKKEIKISTGLNVENLGAIFAKRYPEAKEVMAIYYLCEATGGEQKPGGEMSELKWVNPDELEKHFTTSFHPHLKEYIMNLK